MKSLYQIYRWLWESLDWLYPPKCGGCSIPGTRWCRYCQEGVVRISPPLCPRCGQSQTAETICQNCRVNLPSFRMLRSWAVFEGPIRQALHRLKYRHDLGLGEILSRPLMEILQGLAWPINVVAPVPLSIARQSQRGYNQAALLARPLALATGLAYRPKAIQRVRDTVTQVGLSLEQRRQNVSDAFQACSEVVYGKTVLLVDDVATTGATLDACTNAILLQGASEVYCLTVARAVSLI
jgi:ComF family protein